MRCLLIDHFDSFTANLVWWLKPVYELDVVLPNDIEASFNRKSYDLVVLSAGPNAPTDYPNSLNLLSTQMNLSSENRTPILGVCLGMQMMVLKAGGEVTPYQPVLHGKASGLELQAKELPQHNGVVARYHSLECKPTQDFQIKAVSDLDQRVMWIEHKSLPWLGWQFHPESFLTTDSESWLNYLASWNRNLVHRQELLK